VNQASTTPFNKACKFAIVRPENHAICGLHVIFKPLVAPPTSGLSSLLPTGSLEKTSLPYPKIRRSWSAVRRAFSSIMPPREMFTITAHERIISNSAVDSIFRVSAVRGHEIAITLASLRTCSKEVLSARTAGKPPWFEDGKPFRSATKTFMPRALARAAMFFP